MSNQDGTGNLPLSSHFLNGRSIRWLAAGVGALVLLNLINHAVGAPFWTITRNIDLGSDTNAAAWYSSMLLFVGAILAMDCREVARARRLPDHRELLLLAGLLALMSCDELARFHENLGALVAQRAGIADAGFARHAKWVWVLGPLVIAAFAFVALRVRRTLLRVPGTFRLFVYGILSIVVGGVFLESTINFLNHETLQMVWNLEIVAEEALEMAGSLFIAAALVRWRDSMATGSAPEPT
ncbi:MAG: hypothetical protein DHS20C21_07290 [Gemmatimonadota bacterium]|nr:MAG: hypothetical protein DHS20C21_07290 [Gemmatimonadota bacterium]